MLANKVVKLDNTKVYDQIQKYLEQLGYKSIQTQKVYHSEIKAYFMLRNNKLLEHLTIEDVQLTLDDFEDYVSYLYNLTDDEGNKKYSNKTINKKTSSIKGLVEYLSSKKIDGEYIVKDISYFPSIKYLPENKNHYEVLEGNEIMELMQLALEEREKGEIKSLLIAFAYDTGIRKSSILSLKWADFIKREDEYEIKGVDKGCKDYKKYICESLYTDLLSIKTDSEYVFDISEQSVDKMFRRLVGKSQTIPEERKKKIVFHSLRKAAGTFVYRSTKDLNATRKFLTHSSPNTTVIYTGHDDMGAIGAISSMKNTKMDLYKKTDLETLVEAISLMDKSFQIMLNKKIAELQR